jgi:hypothetical protein
MSLVTVELSQDPVLKRVVLAAFPNYRKRRAFVSPFGDRGQSINSYWDGGSRDVHAIVELSTLRQKSLPTSTHPYFDVARQGLANVADPYVTIDRVGNVTLRAIPPGFVLVTAGTFCGKPATAHLHFHPADLPRYLPAAADRPALTSGQ